MGVKMANPTDAELTVGLRDAASRAGSARRWRNAEKEAAARIEIQRLSALRDRLRADAALAAAGINYEDYVK
jgi:hypothetical protein